VHGRWRWIKALASLRKRAAAFGEDYELLAAVPEAGRFAVVGRCEEGEGVVFLRDGEPVELSGWDHFRA
jgi:thiamine monophosphate kinase